MTGPSHQKQRDEGVVRSLLKAGIRRRYHRLTLADSTMQDAPRLATWIAEASRQEPTKGFTFVGGNDAEDLAILTARGLHVTGRSVFVMTLLRFIELLNQDRQYVQDRLDEVSTLLLSHTGPAKVGDEVFTKRELRQAEDRLNDWMADENRLLIHAKFPLGTIGWFGDEFLQRVASANEVIGGWK